MTHSFHISLAKKYGITKAILLEYLCFWQQKNEANEKHFYDGRYWVFNSIKAFCELFPYLSEKQIRYALNSLEKDKIIYVGNYNKSKYDRTKWYSVDNSVYQKVCFQLHKKANAFDKRANGIDKKANGNRQNGKPIPSSDPSLDTSSNSSSKRYIPPDLIKYSKEFLEKQQENYPNLIKIITKDKIITGAKELGKLIRIDKYDFEEIKKVLDWAITDDFWSMNILSLASVRKKSKRNGQTKFVNIYSSYQQNNRKNSNNTNNRDDRFIPESLQNVTDFKRENLDITVIE